MNIHKALVKAAKELKEALVAVKNLAVVALESVVDKLLSFMQLLVKLVDGIANAAVKVLKAFLDKFKVAIGVALMFPLSALKAMHKLGKKLVK